MKKILVISWFYPPINSSEGLVTFKLINNSKYQYDVFTQSNNQGWTYGKNVDYKNNDNVNVVFSECTKIEDWVEEAYQYFVLNHEKYDYVMTRIMPQECHLVGLKIKKNFPNIKWIASFGDPIMNNPYHFMNKTLYSPNSLKNPINKDTSIRYKYSVKRIIYDCLWKIKYRHSKKLLKQLHDIQSKTLKNADRIILNNESQKQYMIGDNKEYLDKTYIIRHSYDKSFYPSNINKKNDKMRFVFVGHLDEIRNAKSLLHAIKELNEEVNNLSEKVEFVFYGDMSSDDKVFIIDNVLYDFVRVEKPISYQDSLKEMSGADWLIHIDGNINSVIDENIFFAAKIVDYFGSGTNIMAITMQFGDVVEVLKDSNALVLSYSVSEIKNWLYLIIYENYNLILNKEFIQKFDAKNVAKEFDNKVIGE